MQFAAVVRRAREAKGLSQVAVAEELGIGQVSVSAWENGRAVPSVPKLAALATLLDLDHGELLRLAAGEATPVEASA